MTNLILLSPCCSCHTALFLSHSWQHTPLCPRKLLHVSQTHSCGGLSNLPSSLLESPNPAYWLPSSHGSNAPIRETCSLHIRKALVPTVPFPWLKFYHRPFHFLTPPLRVKALDLFASFWHCCYAPAYTLGYRKIIFKEMNQGNNHMYETYCREFRREDGSLSHCEQDDIMSWKSLKEKEF